ncbi:hypothetical protein AAC387_Pa02g2251 [Persea americana]
MGTKQRAIPIIFSHGFLPPMIIQAGLGDLSVVQIRVCNSSQNFFGGTSLPPTDDRPKNDIFLEGSLDSIRKPHSFSSSAMDDGFLDMSALQRSIVNWDRHSQLAPIPC